MRWDLVTVTLASLWASSCGPRGSCAGSDTPSTEGWRANKPAARNRRAASWSHSTAPWKQSEGKKTPTHLILNQSTFCSLWSSILEIWPKTFLLYVIFIYLWNWTSSLRLSYLLNVRDTLTCSRTLGFQLLRTYIVYWVSQCISGQITLFRMSLCSLPGQPLLQGLACFLWILGRFLEPAQPTGDAMHVCVDA